MNLRCLTTFLLAICFLEGLESTATMQLTTRLSGNFTTQSPSPVTSVPASQSTKATVADGQFFTCSRDWLNYHGEKCFKIFSNGNQTYSEAGESCRSLGGSLAVLSTTGYSSFIASELMNGVKDGYWIGLNELKTTGKFTWIDGSDITISNWSPHLPHHRPQNKNCVFVENFSDRFRGKWNIHYCQTAMSYICERPVHATDNSPTPAVGCRSGETAWHWGCYNFIKDSRSWTEANSTCNSKGSSLVWFENVDELNFVKSMVAYRNMSIWTGLNRLNQLGAFQWAVRRGTLTPFISLDEMHITTTTSLKKGRCVQFGIGRHNIRIRIQNCSDTNYAICKRNRRGFEPPHMTSTRSQELGCPYSGWRSVDTDTCMKIFSNTETWDFAQRTCKAFGGELINPKSYRISDYIMNKIPRYVKYWIGVNFLKSKDGTYSDDTPLSYTKWTSSSRSSSSNKNKKCVQIRNSWSYSDKGWGRELCTLKLKFICSAKKTLSTRTTPVLPTEPPLTECAGSPKWYSDNGYCYYLNYEQNAELVDWHRAREYCMNNGGDLASIHSLPESNLIHRMMQEHGQTTSVWIGFNSLDISKSWTWSDQTPVNFVNWAPSNPVNSYRQEKCASFRDEGDWIDYHCQRKARFVCKRLDGSFSRPFIPTPPPLSGFCPRNWVKFGEKCFKVMHKKRSWSSAHTSCVQMGPGHDLASIGSKEEQKFIMKYTGNFNLKLWIGLNDRNKEKRFGWSDNSPLKFTAWADHEPGRSGDCGVMKSGPFDGGQWEEISCYSSLPFLCQRYLDPEIKESQEPSSSCVKHKMFSKYRDNCYKVFYNSKSNWYEADTACMKYDGQLASVQDIYEQTFILDLIKKNSSQLWIGLSNEKDNTYRWSNGWPVKYTNWDARSSTSGTQKNTCATMGSNGKWVAGDCKVKRSFICEIFNADIPKLPKVEGHCPSDEWFDIKTTKCYQVVASKKKWSDASFSCVQKGGYLASFHSLPELQHLMFYVKPLLTSPSVWIGLYRSDYNNELKWQDKSPVDFLNWNKINYPYNGKCALLNTTDYTWKYASCFSSTFPYICMTDKNITSQLDGKSSQIKRPDEADGHSSAVKPIMIALACIVVACFAAALAVFLYRKRRQNNSSDASHSFTFDNEMYESN